MPIIGLCADWDVEKQRPELTNSYVEAVTMAGGTPIILPLVKSDATRLEMLDALDGIVFTGGDDLESARFNQPQHKKSDKPNLMRDEQEYFLMNNVIKRRMPALCICRGMQLLNCFLGGDMYQDIEEMLDTNIDHAQFKISNGFIHYVDTVKDSRLYNIVNKERLNVNSRHHQAVKNISPKLRANAISQDGIVEGLEFIEDMPILALQWHPESLVLRDESSRKIFAWLIDTCK
ncbi:MAG: gamma-glutamyl-gamma-aminobutyrate hydrolase family protein [Eubacteriales bacterium]|nr:gamma-glutamyl-gamma-aminobutyrate hydrolase family protein [Eubacteriales bacterium]